MINIGDLRKPWGRWQMMFCDGTNLLKIQNNKNFNDPSSILYDQASPNAYNSFQPRIGHIGWPPLAKSCNPRSLNLDDPGLIAQFPIYHDEITWNGPLKEIFLSSKVAAQKRAYEAKEQFAPIANILDLYLASNTCTKDRQVSALKIFRDELVKVAYTHFDAYIWGTSVTSMAYSTIHEKFYSSITRFGKNSTKDHAIAVMSCSPKTPTNTKSSNPNRSKSQDLK